MSEARLCKSVVKHVFLLSYNQMRHFIQCHIPIPRARSWQLYILHVFRFRFQHVYPLLCHRPRALNHPFLWPIQQMLIPHSRKYQFVGHSHIMYVYILADTICLISLFLSPQPCMLIIWQIPSASFPIPFSPAMYVNIRPIPSAHSPIFVQNYTFSPIFPNFLQFYLQISIFFTTFAPSYEFII